MRLAWAAVATIVVAVACGGETDEPRSTEPTASTVPAAEATPAATTAVDASAELEWRACGTSAQCSELTVPLDHARPDATTIDLALVRRPATGGDPLGVIFTNPGGPGASGVDWLGRRSPLPEAVAARFDLVSWDPRGVGRSAPVDCAEGVDAFFGFDSDPDDDAEVAELAGAARTAAAACEASAGELLAHVGTDETVHDLERLRVALGAEPLRYVGFSYGTLIGLRYLAAHPDRVGSMVLDAVVDPTLDLGEFLADQTAAFDALTVANLADCAGRDECALADPAAALDDLFTEVETAPLQTVDGSIVGPAEVVDAVIASAYAGDRQESLIQALAQHQRDDATGFDRLADAYRGFSGWDGYLAVTCTDSPRPESPEDHAALADRLRVLSPRLGAAIANELLPCAYWPEDPVESPGGYAAPGAPPVLLIGGTDDPATPLRWAEHVHELLADDVLILHDAPGHTAIGRSDCIDDAVTAYLLDATLPTDRRRCT